MIVQVVKKNKQAVLYRVCRTELLRGASVITLGTQEGENYNRNIGIAILPPLLGKNTIDTAGLILSYQLSMDKPTVDTIVIYRRHRRL